MTKPTFSLGLNNKLWKVEIVGEMPRVIDQIVAPTPEAAISKAFHQVITQLKFNATEAGAGEKGAQPHDQV